MLHDRYPERPKDDVDLLFLMENYASLGNENQLYREEDRFMKEEGFDIDMATIRLFGHDMGIIAIRMKKELVDRILSGELDDGHHHHHLYRLVWDMIGSSFAARDRFDQARMKLDKLRQGFDECLNKGNE